LAKVVAKSIQEVGWQTRPANSVLDAKGKATASLGLSFNASTRRIVCLSRHQHLRKMQASLGTTFPLSPEKVFYSSEFY
jgi:hypothetical protein